MSYNKVTLKQGITLHNINTAKFKTNLCAVFLTFPITYENATKDTLIALMLKRGSKNLKTRQEITSKLAELYGAEFDSGVDKSGDNHVLKFRKFKWRVFTTKRRFAKKKYRNIIRACI